MSRDALRIALPKGRLADRALELFHRAGFPVPDPSANGRQLMVTTGEGDVTYLLVKPGDVPIYVEYGTADLGIAGRDSILESQADVYDALDLGFGTCRMVLAGPRGSAGADLRRHPFFRLATKYPRITEEHFSRKGLPVEVIGLSGSVELACASGLADRVVDLVESGRTLEENHLEEIEVLFRSSARLIVNRASHKLKNGRIRRILESLKVAVRSGEG